MGQRPRPAWSCRRASARRASRHPVDQRRERLVREVDRKGIPGSDTDGTPGTPGTAAAGANARSGADAADQDAQRQARGFFGPGEGTAPEQPAHRARGEAQRCATRPAELPGTEDARLREADADLECGGLPEPVRRQLDASAPRTADGEGRASGRTDATNSARRRWRSAWLITCGTGEEFLTLPLHHCGKEDYLLAQSAAKQCAECARPAPPRRSSHRSRSSWVWPAWLWPAGCALPWVLRESTASPPAPRGRCRCGFPYPGQCPPLSSQCGSRTHARLQQTPRTRARGNAAPPVVRTTRHGTIDEPSQAHGCNAVPERRRRTILPATPPQERGHLYQDRHSPAPPPGPTQRAELPRSYLVPRRPEGPDRARERLGGSGSSLRRIRA